MNPLVKNLKKQVTCSICLDTYTEPKTISCLHTFCCQCLERHAIVSQIQGKFKCPECKTEIDLPEENRFDRLPNSFFHKSLLSDLEAEDRRAIPRQQQETCLQHMEERLRYYCSTCEASVCPICVTEDHRGHAFDVLEKAVQEEKKSIMSTVETIKEKADLFRTELGKLEKASEGSIQVSEKPAVAAKFILQGPDETFRAGVEAKLTLCPRTSGGEMSDYSDLRDQVELLITPAKDVANVTVDEQYDGNVVLKFTPKVPGAYNIEVKINGDKLPTCPMTVQVKERELVVVGELKLKLLPGNTLERLYGTAVNTDGHIVVTDNFGNCVYVFDKDGNCLRTIGGEGGNTGQFHRPGCILFLSENEVLIADSGNSRIQRLNIQTGTVVKSFGKKGVQKGEFGWPVYVTVDDEERIVVTEWNNKRIQVMSKEGESIFTFGDKGPEKLCLPTCCIPYKNMFLVSDTGNHCIKAFDQSGTFLYKFGKEGNQDGQFNKPFGLLLDSSNNLLICDLVNNRVQQFALDGRFTGKSTTRLSKPIAITKAPDGCIFVTSCDDKKLFILK